MATVLPAAALEAQPSLQQLVRAQPLRRGPSVRRRGSIEQGRALETLGHAVEYLIDSRMFQLGEVNQRDENEAVQILMRMSRAVFEECPEVVPIRQRLKRWFVDHVSRSAELQEE